MECIGGTGLVWGWGAGGDGAGLGQLRDRVGAESGYVGGTEQVWGWCTLGDGVCVVSGSIGGQGEGGVGVHAETR